MKLSYQRRSESGAEAAALQTLRDLRWRLASAPASGVRRLQRRFQFASALISTVAFAVGCLLTASSFAAETPGGTIEKGNFRFSYDGRGINGLANTNAPFGRQIVQEGQRLSLTVRFRADTNEG